nr:cytochrome-c peroxidase [Flavobacteriales bacterium]
MSGRRWLLLAPTLGLLAACGKDAALAPTGEALFGLDIPAGWPAPSLRNDNPLTLASVQLGKSLFFDERLSLGRGIACASCHLPGRAFSDTVALSAGVQGRRGFRNAPTLANMAYHALLNRDGGAPTLEQQVLNPLF